MPGKKSTPRSKCRASGPTKPMKKQTVATKKKHVRELAENGRWAEIEKVYGKKILNKAKAYAKKNHLIKTPQEIAREILIKNGLFFSASQTATNMNPTRIETEDTESIERVSRSLTNTTIPSCSTTLTKEQHEMVEKKRQEALRRRKLPSGSPGRFTKEQQERIKMRRQEALDKQRRAQQSGMANVGVPTLAQPPVVIHSGSADIARDNLQPSLPSQPPFQTSSTRLIANTIPRVVTPENLPVANQAAPNEQTRPEYFWNDLEAAAEIVQWENEHMAEAALVQSEQKLPRQDIPKIDDHQSSLDRQAPQENPQTQTSPNSVIFSISQELAAAAEIIQWENEHENFHDAPVCSNKNTELDTPQFKLQPIHVTDAFENERNASEAVNPQINSGRSGDDDLPNELISKFKFQCKRPPETALASALPHSIAVASTALNPGGKNRNYSSLPHRSQNQRNSTAEFIKKHLLEDKLELPVLEFLEMMLA